MTVKELIKALKEMDQKSEVYIQDRKTHVTYELLNASPYIISELELDEQGNFLSKKNSVVSHLLIDSTEVLDLTKRVLE